MRMMLTSRHHDVKPKVTTTKEDNGEIMERYTAWNSLTS
jgi:hypothetical protein